MRCLPPTTLDAGAEVAWPQRYNHDELSAIQHAMNLRLQDEAAFYAEYQNEPLPEDALDEDQLTAEQIAAKLNGMRRREIPLACHHLTAFIDVQQKALFYVVAAWEDDFTGYVIDYGTYPDQKRRYFTLRDARLMLSDSAPGTGLEGSIYAGLEEGFGQVAEEAMAPVTAGIGGGIAKLAAILLVGWLALTWALRRRDAL